MINLLQGYNVPREAPLGQKKLFGSCNPPEPLLTFYWLGPQILTCPDAGNNTWKFAYVCTHSTRYFHEGNARGNEVNGNRVIFIINISTRKNKKSLAPIFQFSVTGTKQFFLALL